MKVFLFSLISFFSVYSLAANSNPVLGRWQSLRPLEATEASYDFKFHFTPDTVSVKVNCHFKDGTELSETASSKVAYVFSSFYEITILDYDHHESVYEKDHCIASLSPVKWFASFDGAGNMTLQAAVPYSGPFVLGRY